MRFSLEFENDGSFDGFGAFLPTLPTWEGGLLAGSVLTCEDANNLPWLAFAEDLVRSCDAVCGADPAG